MQVCSTRDAMAAEEAEGEAELAGELAGEVAAALVSVHPLEHYVAVSIGPDLRVYNLKDDCAVRMSDDSGGLPHSEAIRVITFGANGHLFVSAGDDKLVKIWKTDSWSCIRTVSSEKRVSAAAISNDGQFVSFADKFGVVWLVSLNDDKLADNKAVPILGHYCSIIASMKFSPDGRFIATADRDNKIRITAFPRKPLKGAHEIQSFCLGHTEFVSCLAFMCPSLLPEFLLSGSGDSTVRLWNYMSGHLLDTCPVGDKTGPLGTGDEDDNNHSAVSDICATADASLVAVAIQSLSGVMLLKCDALSKSLQIAKVITVQGHIPTSLGVGSSGRIWTVMGASNLPSSDGCKQAMLLKIISAVLENFSKLNNDDHAVLMNTEVPGGKKLLTALQGTPDIAKQEAVLESVSAALRVSMNNMMIKKQYNEERREFRKRGRNDKKVKQKGC